MIQSVDRALDILMCVSDNQGRPLTVSEIAEKTGLNKSTCCHLIDTLTQRGFLNRVSRSSGYVLGVYAYALTRYRSFQRDLIFACSPVLRWLQNKTGYTTLLATLIDGEKFVLRYYEAEDNPLKDRGELYKGTLYDSATGRAMLSCMNKKELHSVVSKVGLPTDDLWEGIDSFEKLYSETSKLSKENLVQLMFHEDDYYIYKFAAAFFSKKAECFAIGLELKKKQHPEQEEIEDIRKNMLLAIKEIRRRLEFEKI